MIIELKYNIGDKVLINALERLKGRITSVWILPTGVKYEVRFFYNCEKREVYFFEDELELQVETNFLGVN